MLHVITRSILLLLCLIPHFTLTSLPLSHLICIPSSHRLLCLGASSQPQVHRGPETRTGSGSRAVGRASRQVGGAEGGASTAGPRLLPLYQRHLWPGPLSLGRGPHGFLGLRGLHHQPRGHTWEHVLKPRLARPSFRRGCGAGRRVCRVLNSWWKGA